MNKRFRSSIMQGTIQGYCLKGEGLLRIIAILWQYKSSYLGLYLFFFLYINIHTFVFPLSSFIFSCYIPNCFLFLPSSMDLFNLEQFQDNNTTIYYTSQMDLNELHFTYCNCNMYPSSPQHGINLSGRAAITFGLRRCLCIRWKSEPSLYKRRNFTKSLQ